MKVFILSVFILTPLINLATGAHDNFVWGTIVSPKQKISGIDYKFFVYFENNGQTQAYPIETADKKLAELMVKNMNQKVRIQGDVKEVTLEIDGPEKKMLVFIPRSISPLSLSELSISEKSHASSYGPSSAFSKKEKEYDGGGIRINDNTANAMIFTGAAVILGAQLGKIIFNKD